MEDMSKVYIKDLNRDRKYFKAQLINRTNNKKHICETLRLVCDELWGKPGMETAIELLVDAMIMAKKMQNRLYYYQKTYHDDTGNKFKDYDGMIGVRARAKMRRERVW